MIFKKFANKHSQRGQGMTEYIIITGLIAIGAIGVFVAFGDVVRGQVGGMAQELAGKNIASETQKVINDGATQGKDAGVAMQLGDYMSKNKAGQ